MDTESTELQNYKNRNDWLIFFGVIKILIGFASLLLTGVALFGFSRIHETPISIPWGLMAMVIVFCLLFVSFFFTVGIGITLLKKWARSLILIASWFWFIFGIVILLWTFTLLPKVSNQMSFDGGFTYPTKGQLLLLIFTFFIMILLSVLFILFYSGKNVRLTFENSDKKIYWTDKSPLPVLSLFFVMCLTGLNLFFYLFIPIPFQFFGLFIPVLPSKIVWFMLCIGSIYMGYQSYKLKRKGWLGSMFIIGFIMISQIITYAFKGLKELYIEMRYTSYQAQNFEELYQESYLWVMISLIVLYSGYFAWLSRYFRKRSV